MKSAVTKEFFRTIRHSLGRFIAILIISLLGAGVFAGLRMSAPDIRAQGDEYFDATHLYDAMVVSTLGLDEQSLDTLKAIEGIKDIMPAYNSDVLVEVDDVSVAASVQSIPPAAYESDSSDGKTVVSDDDDYLNRLILLEGSWPQSANECVIGLEQAKEYSLEIGDTLTLKRAQDDIDDVFDQTAFTITGYIMAPAFSADITLGTTKMGSGSIELYLYVPESAFNPDLPYTAVYLTIEGAQEQAWGTTAYDDTIAPVIARIEDAAASITHDRTEAIRAKAQGELDDAWNTYHAEKKDAENSLAQAQGELDDAHRQLANSEKQLNDSYKLLTDTYDQLTQSKKQLDQGEAALKSALAQYNISEQDVRQYPQLQMQYESIKDDPNVPDATKQQMQGQLALLGPFYEQLITLDAGKAQYNEGFAQYQEGLAQYEEGLKKYNEGKEDYEDGLDEFKRSKQEAENELADAEQELNDAQKDIDELEPTEVFVVDRSKNAGAASLEHDAESIQQIAMYLPFVFILVAALVILTSITRMVDEERLNIGTHKALGYSNGRIIARYLVYSVLASIIGAIIGVILMGKMLPWFIMTSYSINYSIPYLPLILHPDVALIAIGITVGVALVASWAAAIKSLRETPAALMLPRAPKPGKRILLERIPPIWKHLSFSHKVTARNLLRYKPRFFMAVVGIAGCTALLMVGFGLRDAISDIVDNQYEELITYDAFVTIDDNDEDEAASSNESAEVVAARNELRQNHRTRIINRALSQTGIEFSLLVYDTNMIAVNNGEEIRVELVVPSELDSFGEYVHLRDRESKEAIELSNDAIVMSEKTAAELGLKPGDTFLLYEENLVADKVGEGIELTVGAITENYLQHYIYMSPELYEKVYGEVPVDNSVFVNFTDGADQTKIAEDLLEVDEIGSVGLINERVSNYEEMLQIMSKLIVVILLLAAALAFVVLYNLMNININERVREIATLKVLGFTPREVDMYIFREIFIMVVIGALFGCLLGIPLTLYIAEAAETASMMFGRSIAPLSFVLSFVITLVFVVIIALFMRPKLRRVDMVESLKSIE